MRGLLADVNLQGHLAVLRQLLTELDLLPSLLAEGLELATFAGVGFPAELDDRSVWHRCQADGWMFFTDNRNQDGSNSLEATPRDSWQPGALPVITLASKNKFEKSPDYRKKVAIRIAELMVGVASERSGVEAERYCSQPRIFVPP
jgi:hypothetical protein